MKNEASKTIWLIARIVTASTVTIFSVVAIIAVATAALLPAKYFWILMMIWLIISTATAYGIVHSGKKRLMRTFFAVIMALFLICVNIFAIISTSQVNSFFSAISASVKKTESYNMIVLFANQETYTLSSVGYLTSDPYAVDVEKYISNDLESAPTASQVPANLSVNLTNKAISAALVNDATLDLYESDYAEFFATITVVATYDILVTTESTATKQKSVDQSFVLYISGIDTRDHTLPYSARSDVNILVAVNPKTHKILTVNTPRDMFVDLATSGRKDKLTHAGLYGINESVKTLENFYDLEIDYYARVNFDALTTVVDAIGGIDVYCDYGFKTMHGGYYYQKGWNHLDGKRALSFARERVSIAWAGGDRERGRHQQVVIEAIFDKMLKPERLGNASAILAALAGMLQTNLSEDSMKTLVRNQLDSMVRWEIENVDVDGIADLKASTYTLPDLELFVWWPLEDTVTAARAKLDAVLAE